VEFVAGFPLPSSLRGNNASAIGGARTSACCNNRLLR
jgi:hypothetical protein